MRIHCISCGKSVSTEVDDETIIRAIVTCPECYEKEHAVEEEDRMLKWFKFEHLPEHLKGVSAQFWNVACSVCAMVDPGPERTVALRKLLEAKDAAVRAAVSPGG